MTTIKKIEMMKTIGISGRDNDDMCGDKMRSL